MSTIIDLIDTMPQLVTLGGSDLEDIFEAEKMLNLSFSDEYKEYLLKYGLASWDGVELTGLCNSDRLNVIKATERMRMKYPFIPNDFYVIEFLNIDDIILWQIHCGEIYQTTLGQNPVKVANSLVEYIESTITD